MSGAWVLSADILGHAVVEDSITDNFNHQPSCVVENWFPRFGDPMYDTIVFDRGYCHTKDWSDRYTLRTQTGTLVNSDLDEAQYLDCELQIGPNVFHVLINRDATVPDLLSLELRCPYVQQYRLMTRLPNNPIVRQLRKQRTTRVVP